MISEQAVNSSLGGAVLKKPRSSNLELYRIVCMLMIVAHHYVVNSGLTVGGGLLHTDLSSVNSTFLLLFGAWGKTGINCFLMITGYFMCSSHISVRKFLKLIGQIYFYCIIIFLIFFFVDRESFSIKRIIQLLFPLWGFKTNFISCFIGFWLTIPFLNVLIHSIAKRYHELLLVLLFGMYTLLGSVPTFGIGMEYITWFGIIYLLASYIRLYPCPLFDKRTFWGWMTLMSFVLGLTSILIMRFLYGDKGVSTCYFYVADCNKVFAVAIAVCSFLWFKNFDIKYSRVINSIGAATFGVLLIHANSDAMRQWLWKDTVDVIGHYSLPIGQLMLFSFGVVITIFVLCNLIDQLRIATLEKWFFHWYDNKLSAKADELVERITKVRNG